MILLKSKLQKSKRAKKGDIVLFSFSLYVAATIKIIIIETDGLMSVLYKRWLVFAKGI
jgi:hypothetical protein